MRRNRIVTAPTLESRMNFLIEKRRKPYIRYGKVSIGKEKFIIDQETLQSSLLCKLAGKGGVWL